MKITHPYSTVTNTMDLTTMDKNHGEEVDNSNVVALYR
jgi:hypothetical protein